MAAVLEWLKKKMEPMFLLKRQNVHANHKAKIHQMMLFQAIKVRIAHEAWPIKEIFDEEVER